MPWPAADALFHRDAHWLGGDAVYSIDLGGERILWLFGDSFVAPDGARDRRTATMVRNSIAVQQGRDPERAQIAFHWRRGDDGKPCAFFAGDGARLYWPLDGMRLPGGPLLLFQTRVRDTPGQGLGFALDGWRLVRIDAPDAPPEQWSWREVPLVHTPDDLVFGTAVWRDGDHIVALGTRGDGPHRGVLLRLRIDDLERPQVPVQCWCGDRWQPQPGPTAPSEILPDAGPECSVDRSGDGWLHVYSRGFGNTTLAAHLAAQPTGPWSPPHDLFLPPESRAARALVYAGKAHPELDAGPGWLAVSYAANAFDFAELFTTEGQERLYWPRFWRIPPPN